MVVVAGEGATVVLITGDGAAAFDIGDDHAIGDAVGDGATVVIAHNAAVALAVGHAVGHGESSATDAAAHGAGLVISHNAAVVAGIVGHGMDTDIIAHSAVLDSGFEGVARDAADSVFCCDAGIGEVNTLDGAAADHAEEAFLVVVAIDTYAADGIVIAVEGTLEGGAVGANGGVVVLFAGAVVPVGGVSIFNGAAQLEELAAGLIATVHILRQQVEALGGGDGVGLVGGATVNVFAHAPDVCPVGGVALVAVRVFDDGDGSVGRIAVAARPTVEPVSRLGGVGQGDSGVVGVSGRIAIGQHTFAQVVSDGVGEAGIHGAEVAAADRRRGISSQVGDA